MNVARFTPERLRALATMADRGMVSGISSALRQAANDAEAAARYRDALNDIQARAASGYFVDAEHLGDIARAALKEPTP